MDMIIQFLPFILSFLTMVGSTVSFLAARRERSATVTERYAMAKNIEAEATTRIFDSYGSLINNLREEVDDEKARRIEESAERARLERELEIERENRRSIQEELRRITDRLIILETENQSLRQLRVEFSAVKAQNENLKRENKKLADRVSALETEAARSKERERRLLGGVKILISQVRELGLDPKWQPPQEEGGG
jgi:chromosome segregation ATPase